MILSLLLALPALPALAAPDFTPFGFELLRRVEGKNANAVISPYSVSTALAMTSAGARGATLDEMLGTLHLGKNPHPGMSELRKQLDTKALFESQLVTANRLWLQEGRAYKKEFTALTSRDYGAGTATLDFRTSPEPARQTINKWVEEQTHEKIKDLLAQGAVSKSTNLVLTNAVYFKSAWHHDFDATATKAGDFKTAEGEAKSVPFMHQRAHFAYAEDDGYQLVRLPYLDSRLVMTLVLPKNGHDLAKLDATRFEALAKQAGVEDVILSLPKFKVEQTASLDKVLPKMGMKLAFTQQADFSGIRELSPGESLFISVVAHKAYVDVDEKGTEAAAATAVGMEAGSAMVVPEHKKPKVFHADHPFLFAIEYLPTSTLLFLGRVAQP
jgi:serpin B